MSPLALLVVLLAAFLHAAWNLAAKRSGGDHHCLFLVVLLASRGMSGTDHVDGTAGKDGQEMP